MREVHEETGIEIKNLKFYHFKEEFYFYDPTDEAFHSFLFFYTCTPKHVNLCDDSQVNDLSVARPRWVPIHGLTKNHFHNHGELILDALLNSNHQGN